MNDGSDDHASVEMLNATLDDCRHGAMDANGVAIDLIGQANAGPSAARNRGIAAAETPFVVVLDGDDRLRPAFIERDVVRRQNDGRRIRLAADFRCPGISGPADWWQCRRVRVA